eukprot:TRINITY_DN66700_c10_g5_i1.p1 TRINITY_DN66700_c10_g5~~TRINITY_DN66700_c10_g5_i1.p1  ORF type:complete len:379 (+),score=12.43 TRINITY_DN66700_c10_g5_i1:41-1177(+)
MLRWRPVLLVRATSASASPLTQCQAPRSWPTPSVLLTTCCGHNTAHGNNAASLETRGASPGSILMHTEGHSNNMLRWGRMHQQLTGLVRCNAQRRTLFTSVQTLLARVPRAPGHKAQSSFREAQRIEYQKKLKYVLTLDEQSWQRVALLSVAVVIAQIILLGFASLFVFAALADPYKDLFSYREKGYTTRFLDMMEGNMWARIAFSTTCVAVAGLTFLMLRHSVRRMVRKITLFWRKDMLWVEAESWDLFLRSVKRELPANYLTSPQISAMPAAMIGMQDQATRGNYTVKFWNDKKQYKVPKHSIKKEVNFWILFNQDRVMNESNPYKTMENFARLCFAAKKTTSAYNPEPAGEDRAGGQTEQPGAPSAEKKPVKKNS